MGIIYLAILAAIGFGIYFIVTKKKAEENKEVYVSRTDLQKILGLKKGGVFQLINAGKDFETYDLIVDERHLYDQKGWTWFELECQSGTKKVWLEVESDDDVLLYFTDKKLKFSDVGVEEEQFDTYRKEKKGSIIYEGESYRFEEKGKAKFLKSGSVDNSMSFEYVEFENKAEDQLLTLERWSDGSCEAFVSYKIELHQISVYREEEGND